MNSYLLIKNYLNWQYLLPALILISIIFTLLKKFFPERFQNVYFFYILALIIFIFLKHINRSYTTDELLWIIKPTAMMTGLFSGLDFNYLPPQGFVNDLLNIIIDKSCAGINFFIMSFTLAVLCKLPKHQSIKELIINFIFLFFLCYLLTILANSIRITGFIFIIKNFNRYLSIKVKDLIHQTEGILVYLGLLFGFYFLLHKIPLIKIHPFKIKFKRGVPYEKVK